MSYRKPNTVADIPMLIVTAMLLIAGVVVIIGVCTQKAGSAEVSYADAYAHADKTPMVLVYTTPWCPNCHPYVKRLVSDGIDVVHFENDSIFPLVPHTCVRVRKGEQNYGFDFTGAVSTETIKAAIESCKERVK